MHRFIRLISFKLKLPFCPLPVARYMIFTDSRRQGILYILIRPKHGYPSYLQLFIIWRNLMLKVSTCRLPDVIIVIIDLIGSDPQGYFRHSTKTKNHCV